MFAQWTKRKVWMSEWIRPRVWCWLSIIKNFLYISVDRPKWHQNESKWKISVGCNLPSTRTCCSDCKFNGVGGFGLLAGQKQAFWGMGICNEQLYQINRQTVPASQHYSMRHFTSVSVRPLCPLPVTCVLPHPWCPSLPCPKGLLVTLSMQPHTIPFMGHKAKDTRFLCSILYIYHFYSAALCSFYLCMHELSQIEPAIEMEIIPVSRLL